MSTETLASFVQERRAALGLKQGELAAAIGTSPSYMSQIESGKTRWPHQLIPALARALGVSQVRLAVAAGLIGPEAMEHSGPADANPFPPADIRFRVVELMKQIPLDGPEHAFYAGMFALHLRMYKDLLTHGLRELEQPLELSTAPYLPAIDDLVTDVS